MVMRIRLIVTAFLVSIAALPAHGATRGPGPQFARVCFGEKCFMAEVAKTPKERQRGLMERKDFGQSQAMLFVFEQPGRHSIWMKNMVFPIDIVWLDTSRRVVHLEQAVPPCRDLECPSYLPSTSSQYVVEFPSGTVQRTGIQIGNEAQFEILTIKH